MTARSRIALITTAVAMLVIAERSPAADAEAPAVPAAAATTAPSNPSTWHDYLAGQHAYYREVFVDAYKRVGKHGPWDDAAVKYLERCAFGTAYGQARMLYKPSGVPSVDELIKSGKALLDAGCADPLVRYNYSVTLRTAGRSADAVESARAAVADMEKAGYPPFCVWLAAVHLRRLDASPDDAARLRPAIDAAAVKMVSGKLDDAARRLLVERISGYLLGELFPTQTAFVEKQLKASPDVDPWVRDMLDGYVKLAIGWDMFGQREGWDDEHSRRQLELFAQARDRFVAAWQLAPQLPEPAVKMIQVALGRGGDLGEDGLKWFDRASAAQIDNREAYDRIINVTDGHGGDYSKMYEIGLRAVRTNRYDIEGPWQLVRIVDVMGMGNGRGWDTLKDPPVYDVVCEVAERYAAAHAKDGKDAYYLTFRAAVSWRAGKYADARRYLNKVGDRLVPDAFKLVCGPGGDPATAVEYTYAMSDPRAADIKRGDQEAADGRPNDALATFKAVLAEKDLEAHARSYLVGRGAYIEQDARFERGEWIDVQPDAGLADWGADRWGRWWVDDKGALIGEASTQYRGSLFLRGAKGPRVELSGTVQLNGVGHPTPGVDFRDSDRPTVFANFAGVGVGMWRNGDDLGVTKTDLFAKNCDRPIDFVWTYDRGKFSLKVDGQMLLKDRPIDGADYENAYVGLHVSYGGAKFTKLKVHKLVDKPANPPGQKQ